MTINEMTKYTSARIGIPYIIVCTVPSMDGYASNGAPVICDGFKISFLADPESSDLTSTCIYDSLFDISRYL